MPRIRSIKPEFFTSEDVSALPLRARLTWIGLWLHCDDHGRTKDAVKLLKGVVWPLDNVSLRDVEEDLSTLAAGGRIVRYEVAGIRYLAVVNWHYHQSINRMGRAKCPPPPVSVRTPGPGEHGHCAECWTHFKAHGGLSESSRPVDNSIVEISPGQSDFVDITEDSLSPHGALTPGREGSREGKGGEGASARPPDRCPRHTNHPDPPPCRACGEARRNAETQDQLHTRARATAMHRCRLCDGDGWRYEPGRRLVQTPYIRCNHQPDQAGPP
jgi:hypothetical protein